jgi:hypothetical protein
VVWNGENNEITLKKSPVSLGGLERRENKEITLKKRVPCHKVVWNGEKKKII